MKSILCIGALVTILAHLSDAQSTKSAPGTTTVSIEASYVCEPGTALSAINVTVMPTIRTVPCNQLKFSNFNETFNLTIGNQIFELSMFNAPTILSRSNGDIIFTQTGPLTDPICGGGSLLRHTLAMNRNKQACFTERGLTNMESDFSTIQIVGGKCEGKCFGMVKITFTPGLRN